MTFPERLYTIDILFLTFVLFFAVGGLRRGLSGELAHVLTLIALLTGFCFFYPQLTETAARNWSSLPPVMIQVAVTAILMLAAFLLFFLVQMILKALLKSRMGEATDKITGAVIGLLRGVVTGIALLVALSLIPNETLHQLVSQKSAVGGWVCNTVTPQIYPRVMNLPVFNRGQSVRESQ